MRLCVFHSGKWVPHTVGGPRIERNISFIAHTSANHPSLAGACLAGARHLARLVPSRWGGVGCGCGHPDFEQ